MNDIASSKGLILFDLEGTLIQSPAKSLFPGMKEQLEGLAREFDLCVWTGRQRASTFQILKDLAIMPLFLEVYGSDSKYPKPEKFSIIDLVESYSFCVMLGDSKVDQIGAKNIGAHFIWAGWNTNIRPKDGDVCLDVALLEEKIKSLHNK